MYFIALTSIISCFILYFSEQILMVDYITKTIIKIILFALIPIIYRTLIKHGKNDRNNKKIFKKEIIIGIILGSISFCIIIISYFIFKGMIDFNGIIEEMTQKSRITRDNFLYVGLYITLGNSFLEEYFFRNHIFLGLYRRGYKKLSYLFSSLLFALYHVSIFKTWFNPYIMLLVLISLITVGFLFDYVDVKSESFINSWIIHILSDAAIITIGFRLFGMI